MKVTKYQRTTRGHISFNDLFPGSLFRIHAERSRGHTFSRDMTVYRKATSDEGFYAYDSQNKERAIVLMPEDRVVGLKRVSS